MLYLFISFFLIINIIKKETSNRQYKVYINKKMLSMLDKHLFQVDIYDWFLFKITLNIYILKNIILSILKNNNNNILEALTGTFDIKTKNKLCVSRVISMSKSIFGMSTFQHFKNEFGHGDNSQTHNFCNNNDVIKMRKSQKFEKKIKKIYNTEYFIAGIKSIKFKQK